MSEKHSISKSVRVIAYKDSQKLFERVFSHFPVTFGRSPKTDVQLEFDFVSRNHCVLSLEKGNLKLSDLKSSNGISINGQKIPSCEITTPHFDFKIGVITISLAVIEETHEDEEITAVTHIDNLKGDKAPLVQPPPTPLKTTVRLNENPTSLPSVPKAVAEPKVDIKEDEAPEIEIIEPSRSHIFMNPPTSASVHVPVAPRPTLAKTEDASYHHHNPMVEKDFRPDFLGMHVGTMQARVKKIEAVVTWHDQVYEVQEFGVSEVITVGPRKDASLQIPTLKDNWALAKIDPDKTKCFFPSGKAVSLLRNHKPLVMGDLIANGVLAQNDFGYSMKLNPEDVVNVDLGSGVQVHLRYVPAVPGLVQSRIVEPDQALKQSFIGSAVLHGMLVLIMFLFAPPQPMGPKLNNVPQRFARLLIEKPKPKPTPEPKKPEPEKKEVVQKKPEIKKVVKTHKLPKVLAKVNKFPMTVKNPVPKAPPPVKVENLGALAALGAISKNSAPNTVTNININKDAGGLPTKNINTGGIVGALPSSHGMLAAGGSNSRVKTKGMGYGTGTGYGIQGLKGTAGGRGIAGAIVGEPKLAASARPEGLSRGQVMAVVQKYLGEVQHCYERSLLADPGLAGRMEFEWDISPSGSVTSVRVKRSTVNNGDNLGECVKALFGSMHFPSAKNGQTTTPSIGFPFGRL